jgi:homoserine kinase type II
MAVYSQITAEQLKILIASYHLGTLKRFEGITKGVENSNYHLYLTGGHFILTLFEKRVKAEDLPFYFAFMNHLNVQGLFCPRVLEDKYGDIINVIADRPAAILTFMDGEEIPAGDLQAKHCASLGTAMAAMHLSSLDFPFEKRNDFSLPTWINMAKDMGSDLNKIMPSLASMVTTELQFLEAHWPQALPGGVIHADLFPDNVLFFRDEISGIIDFYFSCTDYFAYDMAIAIVAWCFDDEGTFIQSRLDAYLKAYEIIRPLTKAEKLALPILMRGAALRFLLTRSYDWLNQDTSAQVIIKEPHEYYAKLVFLQNEDVSYEHA